MRLYSLIWGKWKRESEVNSEKMLNFSEILLKKFG